jgi:hypothetical protein
MTGRFGGRPAKAVIEPAAPRRSPTAMNFRRSLRYGVVHVRPGKFGFKE